jgi:hypothetical protein
MPKEIKMFSTDYQNDEMCPTELIDEIRLSENSSEEPPLSK